MRKGSPSRNPRIAGHAAFFDPLPSPQAAREGAIETASHALELIRGEAPNAEEAMRLAIDRLVEAFLIDRTNNRDCFARAHALGRRVNQYFGCAVQHKQELDGYLNECPILALHSRFGLSPGGTTTGQCSICEAPDFGCDHIPGKFYDGTRCFRLITNWDVVEVSVVRRPRDPRCHKLFISESRQKAETRLGVTLARGDPLPCNHCAQCAGQFGPTDEDLDPSSWTELPQRRTANKPLS